MNKPIIIIGNGGHALVLTELLLMNNYNVLGFTAPNEEENKFGLAYLGTDEQILNYKSDEVELVLGVGSIRPSGIRKKIFNFWKGKGYHFKTCIHPTAFVSQTATLNEGAQIMAGVIIQPFVEIGENTIINTGAKIDHECKIKSHVHVAPGTVASGNVQIGSNTHIGTGSKIIQGIHIGENSMVAAGAVVVKDIKDNSTVMGIPAKEVEK